MHKDINNSDKTTEQLAMKTQKKAVPNVEKIADRVEDIMIKVDKRVDPWIDKSDKTTEQIAKKTSKSVEKAHKKVEEFVDVLTDEAKNTTKKNKKEWETRPKAQH